MTENTESRIELECTECHYSKVVEHGGEKAPPEYVKEHGRETGHVVSVTRVEPA